MAANSKTEMPVNIVHGTYGELILFLVLNMWPSHFGLPIMLAIVLFSKKVRRHPTFVNLLVVFMIVGISSSILVYTGQITGPEPPMMLCLFQASLLYGMPAIASLAAFALVFQMFIVIHSTFYGKEYVEKNHALRVWTLIIAPYAGWLVCILATVFVGAGDPKAISRNRRFFYCSVKSDPLTDTLTIVAALILFATLVLEVWTVVLFYKRWASVQNGISGVFTAAELSMPIRVIAFGVYLMVALSLSLLSVSAPHSPVPDLVIASAATVLILIFGTQMDIIRVLCFWRRRSHLQNTDTTENPAIDIKVTM